MSGAPIYNRGELNRKKKMYTQIGAPSMTSKNYNINYKIQMEKLQTANKPSHF